MGFGVNANGGLTNGWVLKDDDGVVYESVEPKPGCNMLTSAVGVCVSFKSCGFFCGVSPKPGLADCRLNHPRVRVALTAIAERMRMRVLSFSGVVEDFCSRATLLLTGVDTFWRVSSGVEGKVAVWPKTKVGNNKPISRFLSKFLHIYDVRNDIVSENMVII